MKILIVGAGGVGGYFGARLIQVGADVTFLLRNKRHQQIKVNGLSVQTPNDSFLVWPKSVTTEELEPIYDLIILTPKAFDLDGVLTSLTKASSYGVFLPFLNGMSHLQALDQKFGRDRVLGGVAHIAAMLTESGEVKQLTDLHKLTVGARTTSHEIVAREFDAICSRTNFDNAYSENIEQTLWDKWVFLATLAGMTTLCRGSVGSIVAGEYGEELMVGMYEECCLIAQKSGFSVSVETQKNAINMLTKTGSNFSASMLRDLQAGLRTEHDHVLGELIKQSEFLKVPSPQLKMAFTQISMTSAG